jgi:hypothetical protein
MVHAPGPEGGIRETPEKSPVGRRCFRVLASAEQGSLGMSARNDVFTGQFRTAEPFSAPKEKNPLTNQGVNGAGKGI